MSPAASFRPAGVLAFLRSSGLITPGTALFAVLWCITFAVATHLAEVDAAALVQQHWGLVLVGFVGAVLGNATAVGGGLVFVPYMMLFYDLTGLESLKLALVTQAFGMTSGAVAWFQTTEVKELGPQGTTANTRGLVLRLIPALALGVWASTWLITPSPSLVKSVFGPVSVPSAFS